MKRILKVTMTTVTGTTQTVSIDNAAADSEITEVKLSAFVDAYDQAVGGVIDSFTKAVVTESTDTIVYPVQ